MKNLFESFKPVDYDTWLAQIKKDLKDKPVEALISAPEKDLEIKAWYHPVKDHYANDLTFAARPGRGANDWKTRLVYGPGMNKKILTDLNDGVDAIGLTVESEEQLNADTAGILFDHIAADLRFTSKPAAGVKVPANAHLNFDVIGLNAAKGENSFSLDDFYTFFQSKPSNKTIWVSGAAYGDAGASTVQELAFTLAHLNEYVHLLREKGVELKTINEKIILELSVSDNYFVNLAKFRAIRELTALLFSGYDAAFEITPPYMYATSGVRFLTVNDANTNFLRSTTQAMSAVLGGCDVLTLKHLSNGDDKSDAATERITKNIQLVLREESYFDKVNDPAAGAYYIEQLTDQLIEKAWALFLEVEKKSGLIACIETNFVQEEIEKNREYLVAQINSGKQAFLGINKFQSKLEQWTDVKTEQPPQNTPFKQLVPFRLEHFYTPKTVAP